MQVFFGLFKEIGFLFFNMSMRLKLIILGTKAEVRMWVLSDVCE